MLGKTFTISFPLFQPTSLHLVEIADSMGTTPAEAALRIYEKSEAMVVSYGMTDDDVDYVVYWVKKYFEDHT